jgi:hypothetical protein
MNHQHQRVVELLSTASQGSAKGSYRDSSKLLQWRSAAPEKHLLANGAYGLRASPAAPLAPEGGTACAFAAPFPCLPSQTSGRNWLIASQLGLHPLVVTPWQ